MANKRRLLVWVGEKMPNAATIEIPRSKPDGADITLRIIPH